MRSESISRAVSEAIQLLRRNMTPAGLAAATPCTQAQERRYDRIFARDAAMSVLGMVASGDADLFDGAVRGVVTLARCQADNGQIPNFVDATGDERDFWYVGCVDATLWWLLAVDVLSQVQPQIRETLATPIRRALQWSAAHEHPHHQLIEQNEASDWADIYPRSGFVLATNALWYRVKCGYGLSGADVTRNSCAQLFLPYEGEPSADRRLELLRQYARDTTRNDGLYVSYVNLGQAGGEGDVLGNLLALWTGLADPTHVERVLDRLADYKIDEPLPARSVCRPITPDECAWRSYMERHGQNMPGQYHNGGAWPFIGGFWVGALVCAGRHRQAADALEQLVRANERDGWGFNEWFDPAGSPRGMRGQSWNAAMLLFAVQAVESAQCDGA